VDEPRKKMPLALALEVMMVDAINIYVRTVLVARGHLSHEGHEASGDRACIEAKYAVVRELAAKWAAFDGYEREQPAKQRQAEPGAAADGGAR
jgi:hypothetical protein